MTTMARNGGGCGDRGTICISQEESRGLRFLVRHEKRERKNSKK